MTTTPWALGFAPRVRRTDAPETGTTGHLLHLQSRSYSQHQALGTFYEELNDLADGLIDSTLYKLTNLR